MNNPSDSDRRLMRAIEKICPVCGHDKTADGCAFCLKQEFEGAKAAYRAEIKSHARTEALRRDLKTRLDGVHRYALRLNHGSPPFDEANLQGILRISNPDGPVPDFRVTKIGPTKEELDEPSPEPVGTTQPQAGLSPKTKDEPLELRQADVRVDATSFGDRLAPCPFCGGEAALTCTVDTEWVSCTRCDASTEIVDYCDGKNARDLWNRRVPSPQSSANDSPGARHSPKTESVAKPKGQPLWIGSNHGPSERGRELG